MAEMIEIKFQIDSDLKTKAEAVFDKDGLNMETAILKFLEKSVSNGKIAFEKNEEDDDVDDWDYISPLWPR